LNRAKEKILFSWSTGKDATLALARLLAGGEYDVVSLLTTVTRDYDRVTMHGVRRELLEFQAASIGLPLEVFYIAPSATNDEYERRMGEALARFQEQGVTGVAFGDICLEDIRQYREQKLSEIGMKGIFPLWKRDTAGLVREFIAAGYRAIVTCTDSRRLGREFAGRYIDGDFLKALPPGVDPAGENGEYHSFAFAGPLFQKSIAFTVGEVLRREGFYFCDLIPLSK
jgi:uncharacterized protein (TIGR00290 family)